MHFLQSQAKECKTRHGVEKEGPCLGEAPCGNTGSGVVPMMGF